MNIKSPFASKNLAEHFIRGVLGIGAVWSALLIAPSQPIAALVLGLSALWAFRGCPICWSIGLYQTARMTMARLVSGHR